MLHLLLAFGPGEIVTHLYLATLWSSLRAGFIYQEVLESHDNEGQEDILCLQYLVARSIPSSLL